MKRVRKKIQINGKGLEPEEVYLDELKELCKYFSQCPNVLKSICKGQCERVGYVDCDILNEFIKDLRGSIK